MIKTIDFHGIKLEESINILEKEIDTIRVSGKTKEYHLIVGNGVIKSTFLEILKTHNIEHRIPMHNSGTIIAFID